jgi:integrase
MVEELLLAKKMISAKWRHNLAKMLERFAARFTGPLGALQTRDLEDWLDSLAGGLRTRRNHRDAIESLVNFARARGYLRKDWDALAPASNPNPPPAQVNLYTPEDLVKLLNLAETTKSGRKLIPLICITAFAGVRHGEMNETKLELLDWSNIDFEGKGIYVGHGAAKTGRDRAVDMPDNLIAWLEPYHRPSGKICSLSNSWNALCRLRNKAGIPPKKNGLRKSFISYKLALTRNIDGVADQAGNSAAIIRKNYKRTDTRLRQAAERWFAIMPTRADILPLFAWAKKST